MQKYVRIKIDSLINETNKYKTLHCFIISVNWITPKST